MDYQHIKLIKQGGFGIVDEVCDSKGQIYAKKTFALKEIAKYSKKSIENKKYRFIQEARFLHSFCHENIVPVLDFNSEEDPPFYIMPRALQSFSADLKEHPKHGNKYFHAIMDILSGLEEIHSMGICHLDLKPSNVLRFKDQEGSEFFAICDFGLMSNPDPQFSDPDKRKRRLNPSDYSAPEILKDLSKGTIRSDIYSMGCILHDILGNKDRKPGEEIVGKTNFSNIIFKCSREDPSLRFGSVKELRDELISLNDVSVKVGSPEGSKCLKFLNFPRSLNETQWNKVINFASEELYSQDGPLILRRVTLGRIQELVDQYPQHASKLGIAFALWTRDADFQFAECDGLSNRLEIFVRNCDLQVQLQCLVAMFFMGTRHDRWYVKRKFIQLTGKNMNMDLASALVHELEEYGQDAREAITLLKKDTNLNFEDLHPMLTQAFVDITGSDI